MRTGCTEYEPDVWTGRKSRTETKGQFLLNHATARLKYNGMKLFDVYPINDITIVKAKGSYVWDDKGEQYLDMYGGHAVISIGHTHPHYVETDRRSVA